MSQQNPINQTNLALAALTASLVKAFEQTNPGLTEKFLEEVRESYYQIREMELSHIEAMETLRWTREFLDRPDLP